MSRKPFEDLSRSQQYKVLKKQLEEESELEDSDDYEHQEIEKVLDFQDDQKTVIADDMIEESFMEDVEMENLPDEEEDKFDEMIEVLYQKFFEYVNDEDNDLSSGTDESDFDLSDMENSKDSDDSEFKENIECPVSENCTLKPRLIPLVNKLTRDLTHELLEILRDNGHLEFPKDRRTLLDTPRKTEISICGLGEYFHLGLKKSLSKILEKHSLKQEIVLNIGIDGLPLSKSTNQKLWPILGKIIKGGKNLSPFVIGAYYGPKDPAGASPFLDAFIKEYKKLRNENLVYRDKEYKVTIKCVICDAPASCLVTCRKNYNGYFGCSKCMVEGDNVDRTIVFLEEDKPLRTDENFRAQTNEEHHHGKSPFEETELDMVNQFPLDYMHLVLLGVVLTLLKIWFRKRKKTDKPLFGAKIMERLSNDFVNLGRFMPKEFNRKPQSFSELGRWKATILRFFLLYGGPVILKNYLPRKNVKHFNLLSCAIRILCDPVHCKKNNESANKMLLKFVKDFKTLYGEKYITYNVHGLIHLSQEVLNNDGPLDSFSAFEFENYMQFLKKIIRKRSKPLQQLHRRLDEGCCPMKKVRPGEQNGKLKMPIKKKRLPFGCGNPHKNIILPNFELTTSSPNNCCILKDKTFVIITGIGERNGNHVIIGKRCTGKRSLENYPINSVEMNNCTLNDISNTEEVFNVNEIKAKACLFIYKDVFYVCELLHC